MKFKLTDELRAVCNQMFKWVVRENTRNPGGIVIYLNDGRMIDPNIVLEIFKDVLDVGEYTDGQKDVLNQLRNMWILSEGYNKKDFKYNPDVSASIVYKFR